MDSTGQAGGTLGGLAPGSTVAGYRIESRIGAGGMAAVFRAYDASLGRIVALKVLAPALADDTEFRERFIRESRVAARVEHPHIIPVHAAGEASGVLYIAMRFVPGGDLRTLLQREGALSADRAALLLAPIASALDMAHAAGLVHRDVKPANILIDTTSTHRDHPYLSDFGLAKGSTSAVSLTGTGHFLGTLEYCAPEQINSRPAVPQTDQYALGCVAYTMLTGAVPFPRDETTAVLWAHLSEPPPRVTQLRPDLPPSIDAVIAKAMAKTPEERYASCSAFAEAFRAALSSGISGPPGTGARHAATVTQDVWYAEGNSVPRPDGVPAHARPAAAAVPSRRARRLGIAAASVAVLAAAGVTAAMLSSPGTGKQGAGKQPPVSQSPTATPTGTAGSEAVAASPATMAASLIATYSSTKPAQGLAFTRSGAVAAVEDSDSSPNLEFMSSQDTSLGIGIEYTSGAVLSPDGSMVAVPTDGPGTADCSGGGSGCVYDLFRNLPSQSNSDQSSVPFPAAAATANASMSDTSLATVTASGNGVDLWDNGGGHIATLADPDSRPIGGTAISPDGGTLATANQTHVVFVWNTATQTVKSTVAIPAGAALYSSARSRPAAVPMAVDNNATILAVTDGIDTWVFDVKTGQELSKEPGAVEALSPDGSLLATFDPRGKVQLWDAATGKAAPSLYLHVANEAPTAVAFSADGKSVAVACDTGSVYVWKLSGAQS